MELFGVGPMELVLIFVVALIIVGPQKLPEMAQTLGRAVGQFKAQTDELRKIVSFDAQTVSPVATYAPATRASELPDERVSAMQRYHGDRANELAAAAAQTEAAAEISSAITISPAVTNEAELTVQH